MGVRTCICMARKRENVRQNYVGGGRGRKGVSTVGKKLISIIVSVVVLIKWRALGDWGVGDARGVLVREGVV